MSVRLYFSAIQRKHTKPTQFVVGKMKMRMTRDAKQPKRPLHGIVSFWKTVLSVYST